MRKTQNGKNKNTKQKQNQNPNQNQDENEISGFTLAMGELDLIFTIIFTDKDLEKPDSKNEDDKYYKIEDMSSIKDLSFLKDKDEEFLNRIKIHPNNEFTKQLLLGNKISKKKSFIDFVGFGRPKFEGEEEFFNQIFNHVTLKNNLQINSTPLDEGSRYSLIIELKHNDKEQTITVGTTPAEEKEKKQKEEEEEKKKENEEKKQKEEQEKQDMEERKQKKIQKYKEEREKKNSGEEGENQNQNGEEKKNNEKKQKKEKKEKKKEKKENKNKGEKKEENKEGNEEEEKEEDYEPNEAMKEKKIPKFKRQKSVLCNLNPSCTKYDLLYINHEDIQKIPGDFKITDLFELLEFFKKKKTHIFINFYKNESSEDENQEQSEEKMAEHQKVEEDKKKEEENRKGKEKELKNIEKQKKSLNNRKNDINENKKDEIKEMEKEAKEEELNDIENKLKELNEQQQDLIDELRAEDEVKKEFTKKKEKEQKKEEEAKKNQEKKEIAELNYIYYLTDGYFFDTKQACEVFTKHYQVYSTEKDKEKKKINKQKVYDYFITCIARGTADEVKGNKIGLFMDDFNKYVIIYATKKTANKQELNAQPHPKMNPHNLELIERYKYILKENKNDYYSIFACLAAQEICTNHGISTEIVFPSFLIALDIVKRKVEYEKNEITDINEDQLYKVRISEKALQQDLQYLAKSSKEGGFVLDCTNKKKSTIKDYVALYDYHLSGFFSSENTRKNLMDKGFIDNKGFIMYDPVYRSVMGAQCKNTKKYEGEELKNKLISSINGIDVPSRIKDKEINTKKEVENQKVPINKQLPFVKDSNLYNPAKKKKKKNKKPGDGSSSSDGYSSEEGKSGDGTNNSKSANEGNSNQ